MFLLIYLAVLCFKEGRSCLPYILGQPWPIEVESIKHNLSGKPVSAYKVHIYSKKLSPRVYKVWTKTVEVKMDRILKELFAESLNVCL